MTIKKGKNDRLNNRNKSFLELYNKINGCLEELVVVSYKLELMLKEKLWDDLMLEPLIDLYDLLSSVKKYARLEDDVRLVESQ